MWFDSHCHLHLCAEREPVDAIVERARAERVNGIVTIGIDVESSRQSAAIAHDNDLWFAAGVHPNSASDWDDTARAALEELIENPRCVAVGETGLDFYRDHAAPEDQDVAFRAHIDLAKRFDKALVIHTRDSLREALDVLEQVGPPERLVFHCWSGAELDRALALGSFVSFAGNVSFANAGDLRAAASRVPRDRLLVETDSPYLSPQPKRGRPNEPGRVALVGAAVAEARGEEPDEVARTTAANARRLFALDGA